MGEKIPKEKLEAAFKFICFANERGGYMAYGEECTGIPFLEALISRPEEYTHLPKPPKKAMFQMWQNSRDGSIMMQQAGYVGFGYSWKKVGEPFEDVYPEESE